MRLEPKIVKGRCGGWYADDEKKRKHEDNCEMCKAFYAHKDRNISIIVSVFLVLVLGGAVTLTAYMILKVHGIF